MPKVRFTRHLRRFFPDLEDGSVDADTVAAVVEALDKQYPGFAHYIVDEGGRLRQHVNIFIGDNLIHDREALRDSVAPDDEVYILQALSGGAIVLREADLTQYDGGSQGRRTRRSICPCKAVSR